MSILYGGLLKDKPKKQVHEELVKLTLSKPVKTYFFRFYDTLKVKTQRLNENAKNGVFYTLNGYKRDTMNGMSHLNANSTILDYLSIMIVDKMFAKYNIFHNARKLDNRDLNKQEATGKEEILNTMINETEKPLWICSSHGDCANDHKPYQGKMYYNENYDKNNVELTNYIKMNHLTSVQEITFRPVWLVTRPHCRHYFEHYSFEDIVHGNYHVPTRKVGSRNLATSTITGGSFNQRKDAAIEYYTSLIKTIKGMQKVYNNDLLRIRLQKAKDLLAKWKQEI